MKKLLVAFLLIALSASPVFAAKQVYTLSLDQDQPVGASISFTATRTVTRITRTEWINVYCHNVEHITIFDTEVPVSWGLSTSRVGRAEFTLPAGSDHCWGALVTTVDYEPQHGDPRVFFTANVS